MPPAELNSARRRQARLGTVVLPSILLLACGPKETAPPPKIEPPPPAAPKIIAPPPALGRADLLQAVMVAASDYAAGTAATGADPLAGRSFTIRAPFGCTTEPAQPAPGLAGRALRAKGQSVELSLTPADWTASPLVAAAVEAKVWDAVEGYWIDRPWLLSDGCPPAAAPPETAAEPAPDAAAVEVDKAAKTSKAAKGTKDAKGAKTAKDAEAAPEPAAPPAASPQTVGLAVVFGPEGSRFGRRNGRAYSFTVRGEGETPPAPPAKGYRLVLEGRFATFPDGRSIRCRAETPDQRPLCVAAAQLDRVAFEDADTGGVISEWRKD